mgnify:CR=1 FL=1
MQDNKTKSRQRIFGIALIVASLPGLGYSLIVSIGGGVFFFVAMIAFWMYWLPSLMVLMFGLNLYWKSRE